MRFRGKDIDPIQLWSNYCEIKDTEGPFLSLTFCPNPDHDNTRSPAFQINISRPTVHCFSHCGISGSYEHAICIIEGLYERFHVFDIDPNKGIEAKREFSRRKRRAYSAARKIILKHSTGKRIRPTKIVIAGAKAKKVELSSDDLEKQLSKYRYFPKEALAYLESRGIDSGSRGRWQLGYDEEAERIVIPVRDTRGRLAFFIRRGIQGWQRPSYLYSSDSLKSTLLFGACNLDRAMVALRGLILVEGSLDCIRLHQHGYRNTVAILGNSISDEQKKEIVRIMMECAIEMRKQGKRGANKLVLFFDKDAGGVTAMLSAKDLARKYKVEVVLYPKGDNLDPAKLTGKQTEKALRNAVPLLRVMKKLREKEKGGTLVSAKG